MKVQERPEHQEHAGQEDFAIDQSIGLLLRWGMILAAAVIFAGGVVYLVRQGSVHPDYRTFQTLPLSLRSPFQIVRGAFHGQSLPLIQSGILLLVATPIARVLFSVIAFAVRRDVLYVLISAIVLAVLLYSLFAH